MLCINAKRSYHQASDHLLSACAPFTHHIGHIAGAPERLQLTLKANMEMSTLLSALLVTVLAAIAPGSHARKIHATIPYNLSGQQTIIGPDGKPNGVLALGSQVVIRADLLDKSGKQLGYMSAHCHVVSQQGVSAWVALCTKHFDFSDQSTMTAHSTEIIRPGQPVAARMVVAGGIGTWEGAHGQDLEYSYNPVTQKGQGKIELTCLKGVC